MYNKEHVAAVVSRLQVDLAYPDLMVKMGEMENLESQ
uniref:Uncharacterized protein n=1 Tax=Acrobeloides nanus TaxID=290746 RepID=A0A914DG57_9BILA